MVNPVIYNKATLKRGLCEHSGLKQQWGRGKGNINTTRGRRPGDGCHGEYGPLSSACSPFLPHLCCTSLYYIPPVPLLPTSSCFPLLLLSPISSSQSFRFLPYLTLTSSSSSPLPLPRPFLHATVAYRLHTAPWTRHTSQPSMHNGRLTGQHLDTSDETQHPRHGASDIKPSSHHWKTTSPMICCSLCMLCTYWIHNGMFTPKLLATYS